jgi:hypothetical protein
LPQADCLTGPGKPDRRWRRVILTDNRRPHGTVPGQSGHKTGDVDPGGTFSLAGDGVSLRQFNPNIAAIR